MSENIPPSQITEYLFLGDYLHGEDHEILNALGISAILNVCKDLPKKDKSNFQFLHYPLQDNGTSFLLEAFDECFEFIDEAKKNQRKVLVHCVSGVNRAPSIVCCYLMKNERWTLKTTFEHLRSRRKEVYPHSLYIQQILEYENQLFGCNSLEFEYFENLPVLKLPRYF